MSFQNCSPTGGGGLPLPSASGTNSTNSGNVTGGSVVGTTGNCFPSCIAVTPTPTPPPAGPSISNITSEYHQAANHGVLGRSVPFTRVRLTGNFPAGTRVRISGVNPDDTSGFRCLPDDFTWFDSSSGSIVSNFALQSTSALEFDMVSHARNRNCRFELLDSSNNPLNPAVSRTAVVSGLDVIAAPNTTPARPDGVTNIRGTLLSQMVPRVFAAQRIADGFATLWGDFPLASTPGQSSDPGGSYTPQPTDPYRSRGFWFFVDVGGFPVPCDGYGQLSGGAAEGRCCAQVVFWRRGAGDSATSSQPLNYQLNIQFPDAARGRQCSLYIVAGSNNALAVRRGPIVVDVP